MQNEQTKFVKFLTTNKRPIVAVGLMFIFIAIIAIFVGFLIHCGHKNNSNENKFLSQHKSDKVVYHGTSSNYSDIYTQTIEFNEYMLYEFMRSMKIQNIDIVFAQSQLETGYYGSDIFKLNNNLFGMKKSYTRPSMFEKKRAKQQYHMPKFAYYLNWKNSVIDYALWQSAYARNLSFNDYIKKLVDVYANGEKTYEHKICWLVKKNKLKLKTYASIFNKNR